VKSVAAPTFDIRPPPNYVGGVETCFCGHLEEKFIVEFRKLSQLDRGAMGVDEGVEVAEADLRTGKLGEASKEFARLGVG